MEMAIWIYLYLTAGKILFVLCFVSTVAFIIWSLVTFAVGTVSSFGTSESSFDEKEVRVYKSCVSKAKMVLIPFVAVLMLDALYPSKEDIAWIVGGSVAAGVATSEEARKLPDNVLSAANSFLEGISEKGSEPKAE